jgi:hypothetical protein
MSGQQVTPSALRAVGLAILAVCSLALAACATSARTPSPVPGATFRMVETNGVTLRVAEAGPASGPLVLLVHGWP